MSKLDFVSLRSLRKFAFLISSTMIASTGLSGAGFAATPERVPLKTVACFRAQRISHWAYAQSYDVINGARDHRAYVTLYFEGVETNGGLVSGNNTILARGMVWDQDFRNVIHVGNDGLVTNCASETWHGQVKNEQDCALTGRFVDAPELTSQFCPGDPSSILFNGAIVVRR